MSLLAFISVLLLVYCLFLILLYLFQNRLFFKPIYYRDEDKLAEIQDHTEFLQLASEGETVLEGVIYQPDNASDKVILYFGGVQQDSVDLVHKFAMHYPQMPFITYNYRGYGMSNGKPSQTNLFIDAMNIYDDLVVRYGYQPHDIILFGYSLGSGVASFLASQRRASEMLLIAPFDSVYAVLKRRYPFSGIHWILKQRFPSVDFMPFVDIPVYIYAASDDEVVDIKHAKMLRTYIKNLRGFYEYGNITHNEILFNEDVVRHIKEVLEK